MNNMTFVFVILALIVFVGGLLQFIFFISRKNTGVVLESNFSEASKKIVLLQDEKIILEVLKVVRGQKFFLFYGYNYCDVLVTNKRIVLGDSYTKYNGVDIVFYNQEDYKINSSIELLKIPYYLDSFYKGEGKTYLKIKSDSFNIRNEKVSISNEIIFKILSDIK